VCIVLRLPGMSVPPDYVAEMASQKPLKAQLRSEVLRRNLVRVVLRHG
jgi:hypothetical protein